MFKDEVLQQIDIKSDVLTEKFVRDQSCQTKPVSYEDKANQVVVSIESESQTESSVEPHQTTRMRIDTSKKLNDFVLKVYPTIVEQLTANLRSHAFDNYYLISDELDGLHEPECKHTIACVKNSNLIEGFTVTALSWNSIGSIIAVAYGVIDHYSWCTHQSFISLSSLNRQNVTEEIQPDKIIDIEACITAIAFNPHQPALLVGGNFSGRIDIWDLSKEENYLVAMSGKDAASHNEVVNDVIWLKSLSTHIQRFVSIGSDGNILMWSFDQLRRQLSLLKLFSLTSDVIPRGNQTRLLKSGLRIGVTCLTVHSEQTGTMLIGTESGCVLKYSEMLRESKEISYAIQSYEGHKAVVNAIDFSTRSDLFITGASDMCVHVYSVVQVKPLHKIDPCTGYIFDTRWSCNTSTAFYVATSSGKLLIYELKDNEVSLDSTIQVSKDQTPLRKIALNKNRSNLMATSQTSTVKIWKFPIV